MSSYLIEPPSPSDLPTLAAIQLAGFASDFEIPLWQPVSPADYEDWALRCLHNPEIPSGTTAEIRAARHGQTGKIVGYGMWSIPDLSAPRRDQLEPFKNTLPRGLDADGVDGFRRQLWEAQWSALGMRPHISTRLPPLKTYWWLTSESSTAHPRRASLRTRPRCWPCTAESVHTIGGRQGHGSLRGQLACRTTAIQEYGIRRREGNLAG
jgi:hypothetical protein